MGQGWQLIRNMNAYVEYNYHNAPNFWQTPIMSPVGGSSSPLDSVSHFPWDSSTGVRAKRNRATQNEYCGLKNDTLNGCSMQR
jgi:hypothetical protein